MSALVGRWNKAHRVQNYLLALWGPCKSSSAIHHQRILVPTHQLWVLALPPCRVQCVQTFLHACIAKISSCVPLSEQ